MVIADQLAIRGPGEKRKCQCVKKVLGNRTHALMLVRGNGKLKMENW